MANGSAAVFFGGNPLCVYQPADPTTLNISIVQYVNSSNGRVTLIRQPILDLQDAAWSFYGWLAVVDWLDGGREVVSITGDAGSIPLMSKAYAPLTFKVPTEGIPTEAAALLRAMYYYFDLHLVGVFMLMGVASHRAGVPEVLIISNVFSV
ncbi:hypothetical protein ACHHYP_06283 [Achlya hypogyna]|uniref:Uncharacterized protein n=1 Tax=Achlya hypogyna TaxID=1202772 RepID=A0A1V9YUP3_ACHHY|nr:hypothetical protein ACHHYP_06283 [Achlya hypogyna]